MKCCRRCGETLPHSQYRVNKRYRDGLSSWCIPCHRARANEWAKENRQRLTEKAVQTRKDRPEIHQKANRAYKQRNAGRLAEEHRIWRASNRDICRAYTAARKASKLRATPPWADLEAIKNIYRLAAQAQALTGVRMHVDHIIPLQHPLVCGLHVPSNLQILPGNFNEAKGNHWPLPRHLRLPIRDAYRQPDMFIEAEGPKAEQIGMFSEAAQ